MYIALLSIRFKVLFCRTGKTGTLRPANGTIGYGQNFTVTDGGWSNTKETTRSSFMAVVQASAGIFS